MLEWTFVAVALVLGTSSLAHSYRAIHRDRRAIMLFGMGVAALVAVRIVELEGPIESAIVFCAAMLIVSAHLLNLRLGRSAKGCGCPCEDDDREHGGTRHGAPLER